MLQALLEATVRQSDYVDGEKFDLDEFQKTVDQKDVLLKQLNELDAGFEQVFQEIRVELKENQPQYQKEIDAMQALIRKCTDIGVQISRIEVQNKDKIAVKFAEQKKALREIKTSSKVASTYYKTMSNMHHVDSYFMDQKE